jgi:hypothetical protein
VFENLEIAGAHVPIVATPDRDWEFTSHVESTGRGSASALTSAFSRKWENLWAACCLWFAFYSFCRTHKTLRVTPAMEAGITDQVWSLRELLV